MVKYVLLAVEGPHDQATVGRLLKLAGLKEFQGTHQNLDPFWQKFVPVYPSPLQRIHIRLDMPSIYESEACSVAIYQGEGNNLVKRLKAIITNHPCYRDDIDAFGVIVDADAKSPQIVAQKYVRDFGKLFPGFSKTLGVVSPTHPRTGLYVLPNNVDQGTLDTLLVKCADVVYADLKVGAKAYLDQVPQHHKTHWTNFDEQKALVATVTSVLKPGAANTPSIAQNDWICERSLANIAELAALNSFLWKLLRL